MPAETSWPLLRQLRFGACESEDDYAQVLALRHLAYGAAGKVALASLAQSMADVFDEEAVILTAHSGEKLAGTARVVLARDGHAIEYDAFTTIPNSIERSSLAVLSRIATHPEFRGGGLLYALVLRSVALALGLGKKAVLGGCTRELLPVYQRVGAQDLGVAYTHEVLGSTPEHLIVWDVESVKQGVGVRADCLFISDIVSGDVLLRRYAASIAQ